MNSSSPAEEGACGGVASLITRPGVGAMRARAVRCSRSCRRLEESSSVRSSPAMDSSMRLSVSSAVVCTSSPRSAR